MKGQRLITIDGPSASGKSSVSRLLAKRLNWPWVSTGAFYRGLALASIKQDLNIADKSVMEKLAIDKIWQVRMTAEDTLVFYDDVDVTSEIAGEQVGLVASQISQIPMVRKALLQRQRDCFVENKGLVAEGRDCGTVVFPHAPAKVFLTASPDLRALRRSEEESQAVEKTLEMQKKRDLLDSQRKVAPLKIADGALQVDSSYLSLEEVVDEVFKYLQTLNIPLTLDT
jgi:CMP/dCMP kinase